MLHYSAVEKIVGGKLLGVDAWIEGDIIERVKITGDFFLHPEDSINDLEDACAGVSKGFAVGEVESKITTVIDSKQLNLVGFTAKSLEDVLRKALSGEPIG